MPADPLYSNDKLECLVRNCIIFPADGSETRIVPMVARTVTVEDNTSVNSYSRCVDMATTFGDSYRKTRVMAHQSTRDGVQSTYLFFYNLSPNLRINRNVANLIGETPSALINRKQLFWRGDVVAMKVQSRSESIDSIVESMDADLSELKPLEEFLRERYQERCFEYLLDDDERKWNLYLSSGVCGPSSLLFGPPKSYWGQNAADKEVNFLHDLNELRCAIGRPPFPPHVYMKSHIEHAVTPYAASKSALRPNQKVTGPPKLPLELERQIFEVCALESPELCAVLVRVARRVNMWIDPILIATVSIMEGLESKRLCRLERFLAKLTNGKPAEYYVRHVKNLAIFGPFASSKDVNRILAICSGVENLVLLGRAWGFDLLRDHQAGRHLRRLTVNLLHFEWSPQLGSTSYFYHPCFANLTHLHLMDDDGDWSTYTGWENLVSLTHLAFACYAFAGPEEIVRLMRTLPTLQYVALGYYRSSNQFEDDVNATVAATVNNIPHTRAEWGVQVVFLGRIPEYDWERGARGQGDFWGVVEREVKRGLRDKEVD